MRKKFLIYLFILLFGNIMKACMSDDDCSNGQGYCIPMGKNRYCSCISGFGGYDCSLKPSNHCFSSFQEVEQLDLSFNSTIETKFDPIHQQLTIIISIGLQKNHFLYPTMNNDISNTPPYSEYTLITFQGNETNMECNYPNSNTSNWINWKKYAASKNECIDKYELNANWEIAKNQCNFILTSQGLEQYITVSRKYKLASLRNFTLESTISITYLIR